jgi:hypothetical protein
MSVHAVTRAGSMLLVGLLSACVKSDSRSISTAQTGAPWVQNLSEPPPIRESASNSAARLQADLDVARARSR